MKKQRVLFDMDGCLVDLLGKIGSFINEHHSHVPWSHIDLPSWDLFSTIPDTLARQEALEHMRSEGFFRSLELVDEAYHAYQELVEQGHDVRICTTPLVEDHCVEHSMHDKREWVRWYLGSEAAGRMIFSFNKTEEEGDVIIDDKPTLTLNCKNIRFKHWLIVDHSYNRVLPDLEHKPIDRIKNDWSNWRKKFAKLNLI
jgi:5'-nucleotidase